MKVKLREDKKVEIGMTEQIVGIIRDFSEEIKGKVTSPATDDLYVQHPHDKELQGARSDEFHLVTQKLLFICKRARPDIETTVAYLCTRVTKSTEGDWRKLRRVLQFLNCTVNDT